MSRPSIWPRELAALTPYARRVAIFFDGVAGTISEIEKDVSVSIVNPAAAARRLNHLILETRKDSYDPRRSIVPDDAQALLNQAIDHISNNNFDDAFSTVIEARWATNYKLYREGNLFKARAGQRPSL